MGGVLKQYQVITSPERLAAQRVTLQELAEAAEKSNVLAGGGVMVRGAKESLIRIQGQGLTAEEIAETVVAARRPRPVRIKDVADVRLGGPVRRGDGSVLVREGGDVDSALKTAQAIGDDRLQKRARGWVSPEKFTHGTSRQRVYFFTRGFKTGDCSRATLDKFFEVPMKRNGEIEDF